MAKRPFPTIPRAYMVPEPKVSDEHRQLILKSFPLADPSEADAVISEVEDIPGEFQADLKGVPEVKEAFDQLKDLAEAASQAFIALGALGLTAHPLLIERERGISTNDLSAISRSVLWLSSAARRAAEDTRPSAGRPIAWPERTAAAALAELWARRTGKPSGWSNTENDGGSFARFVYAVSDQIGERSIRAVLENRGRNSTD